MSLSEELVRPAPTADGDDVDRFMAEPAAYFGHSATEMHSIPRAKMDALQNETISRRFKAAYEHIPMVKKLADGQGVSSVDRVEDVVPLLFEHTMYKSYPISLLGNRRFDMLTGWLNKLTSVDLSKVDVKGCDSIDGWLDAVFDQSGLDVMTSSGSTGTMSFLPRTAQDYAKGLRSNRVTELQTFGQAPTDTALNGVFHVIWPNYADGHVSSFRSGQYQKAAMAGGREDHFHPLYHEKGSSDLMWLAAQMRAAAARGDASRIEAPPSLLARREELAKQQAGMQGRQQSFIGEVAEQLKGQLVYCIGPTYPLWQVAQRGMDKGATCEFAPGSFIGTAGGAKGMPLPADWEDTVSTFFGTRVQRFYGMSEIRGLHKMCSEGHYHVQPWVVPFVLDPDTSELKPRTGLQKGRAAFFDLSVGGNWGGLISGDEVEIHFSEPCKCGQSTVHILGGIQRYSEKNGGDDKITCAATPQAHSEALEYLTGFGE